MNSNIRNFLIKHINQVDYKYPNLLLCLGYLLILIVGILDFITGYELSVSLFYLLPIFLISWFSSPKLAISSDFFAALAWFIAEKTSGRIYSNPSIYLWNTGIRLGFFLIFTMLLLELKETLKNEIKLARTDSLTGAANNRYFIDILTAEIRRCNHYQKPLSIAYIDLDNFKQVNDEFGHSIGDEVLCFVVDYIAKNIRNIDLIARLGGDEFVLLLPETDCETANTIVSRLREHLLIEMERKKLPITFSIGLLTCIKIDISIDEIIGLADNLMYAVKNKGKNSISHATYPAQCYNS